MRVSLLPSFIMNLLSRSLAESGEQEPVESVLLRGASMDWGPAAETKVLDIPVSL